MKLLKAFIRTSRADAVIRAPEAERAPGVTLSRARGVGYGYEPLRSEDPAAAEEMYSELTDLCKKYSP